MLGGLNGEEFYMFYVLKSTVKVKDKILSNNCKINDVVWNRALSDEEATQK